MANSQQSQCQSLLMHIDALLDGEVPADQSQELQSHLGRCSACRMELAFARRLHAAIGQLPEKDCGLQALEPVQRLLAVQQSTAARSTHRRATGPGRLADWWHTLPGTLRYAVPGVVAVAVLVMLGQGLLRPTEVATPLAATSPAAPSYSDAEIQQAMADLELALSYLEQVSRRTSTLVREEILTEQLGETFSVSARIRNNDPQTGPDAGIGGPI